MQRRITPELITTLNENEIFVFGSNELGYHGRGAAKLALDKFSAKFGQAHGMQGQSYAIPTLKKDICTKVSYEKLNTYIRILHKYVNKHQELKFYITKIGCGLAGFDENEIAPLFKDFICIENVYLPESFITIIESNSILNKFKHKFFKF